MTSPERSENDVSEQITRLQPQPFFRPWQWIVGWLIVIVIVTTMVLVVVNVLETRSQSYKVSDAECARRVSSEQTSLRDEMTVAKAKMDSAYVLGQLHVISDPSALEAESVRLEALAADLSNKVAVVERLPDLSDEVERRCAS